MANDKIKENEENEEIEESAEEAQKKISKSKKIPKAEYEKKVLELAETGLTSEKIGEKLRKEDIHPKDYDKKISEILKENKKYVNPDLKNVETKLEKIKKHYSKNKQDKRAMREKDRIFAQLRKIKKYFEI